MILHSNKEIKARFFEEIEGHWILSNYSFEEYLSQKNFLDNSYNRFHNRIGLTTGGINIKRKKLGDARSVAANAHMSEWQETAGQVDE